MLANSSGWAGAAFTLPVNLRLQRQPGRPRTACRIQFYGATFNNSTPKRKMLRAARHNYFMAMNDYRATFNDLMINTAPDEPGVYALYDNGTCIYYGSSTRSIRSRLKDHRSGAEGRCTQSATHFNYEVNSTDPVARERELILENKRIYGRLPRCNAVVP